MKQKQQLVKTKKKKKILFILLPLSSPKVALQVFFVNNIMLSSSVKIYDISHRIWIALDAN